jgi:hypothetical protein
MRDICFIGGRSWTRVGTRLEVEAELRRSLMPYSAGMYVPYVQCLLVGVKLRR